MAAVFSPTVSVVTGGVLCVVGVGAARLARSRVRALSSAATRRCGPQVDGRLRMRSDERRMAGYSGTPLPKKLGIKDGTRLALLASPKGFKRKLAPLPPGVEIRTQARGKLDVILFFATRRRELERRFPVMARALVPHGGLWVAWPKKASGVATDLTVRAGAGDRARLRARRQQGLRDRRHVVGSALRRPTSPTARRRTGTDARRPCAVGTSRCRRRRCSPSASTSTRSSIPEAPEADYNVAPRNEVLTIVQRGSTTRSGRRRRLPGARADALGPGAVVGRRTRRSATA